MEKWIKLKFVPKGNYPSRMGYYDQKGEPHKVKLEEGLIIELPEKYGLKDWWDPVPKAAKKKADRVKRNRKQRHRRAQSKVTRTNADSAFRNFGAEVIDPTEAKGLASIK